jgi:glycolate oxidase iron-sulfur subunit
MSRKRAQHGQSSSGNRKNPGEWIDPTVYLKCVHCGLCTSACPTYTELDDENDGPRGRIYLMRLVAEGELEVSGPLRRHLELCLDCRACETACPSGVRYGRLIEPFRLAMDETDTRISRRFDWFRQLILLRVFPYARRIRLATAPVRLAQRLGIYDWAERLGLLKLIPGRLGQMLTLVPPPIKPLAYPSDAEGKLDRKTKPARKLPRFLPAVGRKRARVAFFTGCVADAMFRHTHWATLRVLQQNGCDVLIPEGQVCCGAIHYHAGSSEGARKMADANLAAFDLEEIDAVIVNHAGCGAMMKEYGLHWDDDRKEAREQFARNVRDASEFLDELGLVPPSGRIDAVATYHDACHLGHAQKIVDPPRRLLSRVPGLELRELPESAICCGSAGTYNLNHHEMADRLSRRKLQNILSTKAQIVLASNAGCLLQIMREIRRQRKPLVAMHPMDLLDLSYRNEQPELVGDASASRPRQIC